MQKAENNNLLTNMPLSNVRIEKTQSITNPEVKTPKLRCC